MINYDFQLTELVDTNNWSKSIKSRGNSGPIIEVGPLNLEEIQATS